MKWVIFECPPSRSPGRVPVAALLAPNAFQQGEKAAITLKRASESAAPPGSPVLRLLLLVNLARSIHSCEVK